MMSMRHLLPSSVAGKSPDAFERVLATQIGLFLSSIFLLLVIGLTEASLCRKPFVRSTIAMFADIVVVPLVHGAVSAVMAAVVWCRQLLEIVQTYQPRLVPRVFRGQC